MTYRNRDGWLWLAAAFLSPFHRVRAMPSGRALILRTKPIFVVLAADAVSIAIAVFAASYFAAALVSGAGQ
jgi:hypothetical protein